MELAILFVGAYGLICFLIGEFFGRAKHIGRWWTMFLFWVSPIPILGLIALISSPKATKEVGGKSVKWAHWVFVALLVLTLLSLVNWLISLYQFVNIGNNFYAFKHRMSITFFLSFGLNTVYFYLFSRGRIVNHSPKNYFGKFRMLNQEKIGKVKFSVPNINFKSDNNHLYYIKKDNETEQEGPYDFNELKQQRIKSGSWVWRKGLDQWVKVDELKELEAIIVHLPPEFKNNDNPKVLNVNKEEDESDVKKEVFPEKKKRDKVVIKRRRAINRLSIYRKVYYLFVTVIIAVFLLLTIGFIFGSGKIHTGMPSRLLWIIFVSCLLLIPISISYIIKQGYNHKEKWARVNVKSEEDLVKKIFVFGIKTLITYSVLVLIGLTLYNTLLRRDSKSRHRFHLSHFVKNNSDTLSKEWIDVFIGENYGEPSLSIQDIVKFEDRDGNEFGQKYFYLKDYQERVEQLSENSVDSIVRGHFISGKVTHEYGEHLVYPLKGEFDVYYLKGKDVKNVFKLSSIEKEVSYSSENVNNWEVISLSKAVYDGEDRSDRYTDHKLTILLNSGNAKMTYKSHSNNQGWYFNGGNEGELKDLKFDEDVSFEDLIAEGKGISFNWHWERGISTVLIQRNVNSLSDNDVIIQMIPISGDGSDIYMEGELESIRFNSNQKNDH